MSTHVRSSMYHKKGPITDQPHIMGATTKKHHQWNRHPRTGNCDSHWGLKYLIWRITNLFNISSQRNNHYQIKSHNSDATKKKAHT